MSETRPSGDELDGAAKLLASVRARGRAAAADLSIPDALRLSEWQRSTVGNLYAGLVRTLEDELRGRLAGVFADEGVRAALGSAHLPIAAPILAEKGHRIGSALAAALLRRAQEHRLARSADYALLGDLAGDDDGEVAAQAMSLLILQSSRTDGFGEPAMGRSELPAELEHRLAWTIAAALRHYLTVHHAIVAAEADSALAPAVADLLARYDEGSGVEARALHLARRLAELGRLDDGLLTRILGGAGLPLLLAALAVRTGLAPTDVWALLAVPEGAVTLLRAAGVARETAATILLQLEPEEQGLPERLDGFDAAELAAADASLIPWRADPAYRAAIGEIGA